MEQIIHIISYVENVSYILFMICYLWYAAYYIQNVKWNFIKISSFSGNRTDYSRMVYQNDNCDWAWKNWVWKRKKTGDTAPPCPDRDKLHCVATYPRVILIAQRLLCLTKVLQLNVKVIFYTILCLISCFAKWWEPGVPLDSVICIWKL